MTRDLNRATTPATLPPALKYAGEIMSTFTGEVSERVDALVRAGTHWGQLNAADFFGKVWFDAATGDYYCEVWCWRKHQETLGGTLQGIADEALASWGEP